MRQPPLFSVASLVDAPEANYKARASAYEALTRHLEGGQALEPVDHIIDGWQLRFLNVLGRFSDRLESDAQFPPLGLAAFRSIADYIVVESEMPYVFPWLKIDGMVGREHDVAHTPEHLADVFACYKHSGRRNPTKVRVAQGGSAESALLAALPSCRITLGGQAGNIVALWRAMGGAPRLFVPMRSCGLAKAIEKVPGLGDVHIGLFSEGAYGEELLQGMRTGLPVRPGRDTCAAPSGGSVAIVNRGQRQLWLLTGFRDLAITTVADMPFQRVELLCGALSLGSITRPTGGEWSTRLDWPHLPVFGESWIEDRTLRLRLATREEARMAYAGRVTSAVLGGLDALFKDVWLEDQPELAKALQQIVLEQIRGLRDASIRIGVEMSAKPGPEYFGFLRNACRDGLIATLGVNGEEKDELPRVVASYGLLAPEGLPPEVRGEALELALGAEHPYFEYLTYRRGLALANFLEVDTLYVHTTAVDMIFQRNASEASLLRAQAAAMISKELGLGGLLRRNYGERWREHVQRLPGVVKPDALVRLHRFAGHYMALEGLDEAHRCAVIDYGIAARARDGCSLAVLPVLWPAETDASDEPFAMREDFNSTGAGDMSFGAFFLLQNEEISGWTSSSAMSPSATG